MSFAVAIALLMVAVCGGGVALTRDPLRQAIVFAAFGVSLTILFFVLEAPDVALSELAVGSVFVPVITLIAIVKTTRAQR
jgi:energy-converting hydrogenase B subunit D